MSIDSPYDDAEHCLDAIGLIIAQIKDVDALGAPELAMPHLLYREGRDLLVELR